MRTLFALCLLFLFTGLAQAQSTDSAPSPHHAGFNDYFQNLENRGTITGKVLNLPDSVDREKLIGYAAVALNVKDQKELTATVAPDGTFNIELPQSVPVQEVWFWLGDKFYTALAVHSTVHIEMDYAQLIATGSNQWTHPAVTFSGPDAVLCDVRGRKIAEEKKTGIGFIPVITERGLSTPQKLAKLDSVMLLLQASDEKLLAGRSKEAADIINHQRLTEYLSLINVLYWNEPLPSVLLKRYLAHSPMMVSNRTRDFYQYFTTNLLNEVGRSVAKQLNISQQEASGHPMTVENFLERVNSSYSPERADLLKLYLSHDDPVINLSILESVLPTISVPWCKASIRKQLDIQRIELAQLQKSLSAKINIIDKKELGEGLGHLDFSAELYKSDASSGQELLDQLRGAFPGKAIYLDLWAVWCGPCIQQMPFSKKAHEAAAGLPIEFVYLCTESGGDQEKWQNLIASNKVPGTHLFVPEAPHNELLKLLLGRGYPTYVLIQPDGTVVHDVPRPSELDREKLERLLEGK